MPVELTRNRALLHLNFFHHMLYYVTADPQKDMRLHVMVGGLNNLILNTHPWAQRASIYATLHSPPHGAALKPGAVEGLHISGTPHAHNTNACLPRGAACDAPRWGHAQPPPHLAAPLEAGWESCV